MSSYFFLRVKSTVKVNQEEHLLCYQSPRHHLTFLMLLETLLTILDVSRRWTITVPGSTTAWVRGIRSSLCSSLSTSVSWATTGKLSISCHTSCHSCQYLMSYHRSASGMWGHDTEYYRQDFCSNRFHFQFVSGNQPFHQLPPRWLEDVSCLLSPSHRGLHTLPLVWGE